MTRTHACIVVVLLSVSVPAASAQSAGDAPFTKGTFLGLWGGAATQDGSTRATLGGAIGWEVTPRFVFEGRAAWFERPEGDEAFAAAISAHVNLVTPRPVVPFLSAGFGLYWASFGQPLDRLPDFHGRRVDPTKDAIGAHASFADPSFEFGGGVTVFTSRHVSIRPEVIVTTAFRDGRTYSVASYGVQLSYHFEDHPITPSRRLPGVCHPFFR